MFPAPYGDFVFQRDKYAKDLKKKIRGFRPLTGILFFNVCAVLGIIGVGGMVSVPLRGFCFSTSGRTRSSSSRRASFRPLTGILFFNIKSARRERLFSVRTFPSPYGDFVFQLVHSLKGLLGKI